MLKAKGERLQSQTVLQCAPFLKGIKKACEENRIAEQKFFVVQ